MKINVLLVLAALLSASLLTSAESRPEAAQTCSACHGDKGVSSNPLWPNLAGQKAGYLAQQLRLFKSGERNNPLMAALVANLSEQQIDQLASYYAGQQPATSTSGSSALIAEGERLSAYCVACHGMTGHSINREWPNLAGQQADYLRQQLLDIKSGKRFSPQMRTIIKHMDEPQFSALAAYYSQLKARATGE